MNKSISNTTRSVGVRDKGRSAVLTSASQELSTEQLVVMASRLLKRSFVALGAFNSTQHVTVREDIHAVLRLFEAREQRLLEAAAARAAAADRASRSRNGVDREERL